MVKANLILECNYRPIDDSSDFKSHFPGAFSSALCIPASSASLRSTAPFRALFSYFNQILNLRRSENLGYVHMPAPLLMARAGMEETAYIKLRERFHAPQILYSGSEPGLTFPSCASNHHSLSLRHYSGARQARRLGAILPTTKNTTVAYWVVGRTPMAAGATCRQSERRIPRNRNLSGRSQSDQQFWLLGQSGKGCRLGGSADY